MSLHNPTTTGLGHLRKNLVESKLYPFPHDYNNTIRKRLQYKSSIFLKIACRSL